LNIRKYFQERLFHARFSAICMSMHKTDPRVLAFVEHIYGMSVLLIP